MFVSPLPPSASERGLREIFERFGLIYDVWLSEQVPEGELEFGRSAAWAVITFYSNVAAHQAATQYSGTYDGKAVRARPFRRSSNRPEVVTADRALPVRKSAEILNFYLPLRWNSTIVAFEPVRSDGALAPEQITSWKCTVKICIDSVEVIGEGIGEREGDDAEALGYAKKKALGLARKNAFSKIAIVQTSSGKVGYCVASQPLSSVQYLRAGDTNTTNAVNIVEQEGSRAGQ